MNPDRANPSEPPEVEIRAEFDPLWRALEPTSQQLESGAQALQRSLVRLERPSLVAEWVEVLRLRPIFTPTVALAAVVILSLLMFPPRLLVRLCTMVLQG